MAKQITAIIVGAGHRALLYSLYALQNPEKFKIVGVADPDPIRRRKTAEMHGFGEDMCFESAEALAERPRLADAVINGTMDTQHVKTAVPLLRRGYEVAFTEVAMYLDLSQYAWNPALDEKIAALAAEGIRVGRWEPGCGTEHDELCDHVGSEYWRHVLDTELEAWQKNEPNADPSLWPDGRRPAGPRPLLTATTGGHIVAYTGPVDLQKSGRGWFTGICCDPNYGGRGIASILFNQLMREFVAEGAKFSTLFTGETNFAQKIYSRAGFRIVARFDGLTKPLKG